MSFVNDISKIFGGGTSNIVQGYNIVNMDGQAVYIDGVFRILQIGDSNIRLATKKKIIDISGTDLTIAQSNRDIIIVKGNIVNISCN